MRPVFLIPFPALALVMGLAYVYGDPRRTSAPSFNVARSLAPVPDWGLLFLIGATLVLVALLLGNVRLLSWSLFAGGTMFTWWAGLFLVAALTDPKASITAPAIHGTIAFWHFVTAWRVRVPA